MKKLFFGFIILLTIKSNAQEKMNSNLNSLINNSFHYFSKSKEVENNVISAQEKLKLAEMSRNPEIEVAASYNYIMPKISFPINGKEIQFAPVNNISSSIGSSYNLFDFGRFKASVSKAKAELQYSKDNLEYAKHQLANQVATIYYNIVYYKKAIVIQDSIISYFKENKKFIVNKVKSGDMLELDVYNLQSSIDFEENKKVDLTTALQKQSALLEYITGDKEANGTTFDFDASTEINSSDNPELTLAKDKIKIAQQDLTSLKLNNKPTVGIRAGAGFRNGFIPEVENLRFNYMAGLFLNIPISNFGKTKQQIKVQQTIVKQSQLNQESLISANKKDINQAMIDISANTERIQNCKSQIEACNKSLQITNSRYTNGVATYLDVANAVANLQKASLFQLQYEYQLCLAKIELSKLTGYQFWK
jgi:hypothetical protein